MALIDYETELYSILNCEYDKHCKLWEKSMTMQENIAEQKLQDNTFCVSIGLPENLPEFTVGVLKRTISLDICGDAKPKRNEIYKKFGV